MEPVYNRGGYEIKTSYIGPDLYNLSAEIDYGLTTFTETYVLDDSKRDNDDWHERVEEVLAKFVELLNEQDITKVELDKDQLDTIKRLWASYRSNMMTIGSDDWLDYDDFTNWVAEQIDEIDDN